MPRPTSGEPTLPGNPNNLTWDQHIFPRAAIAQFAGDDGQVQVQYLVDQRVKRRHSKHWTFCAERAWDHKAETGLGRTIEERYNALSRRILAGEIRHLSPQDNHAVTLFYALWNARHVTKMRGRRDGELKGLVPGLPHSKEEEELLELNGYAFLRGGVLPSHIVNGSLLSIRVGMEARALAGLQWGIVRARQGEFLVPDNVCWLRLIPVSPNTCLSVGARDLEVPFEWVAKANRLALQQARSYVFANDLQKCPVQRRTIPLEAVGGDVSAGAGIVAWSVI